MTGYKGRKEDGRLLTGAGRYTSDWNMDGQLHAALLRSPYAHARLLRVDAEAARAMPGVRLVLTGADMAAAGFRTLKAGLPFKGASGESLRVPERLPLATDRVRHVGEEIALVVAETRHEALDAAEAIEVEYDELPVAVGVLAASAEGAPLLHEDIPGNICFEHAYGDAAATEAAMAAAHHVTRLVLDSPRVSPNPMEPRSALAWQDDSGALNIRCSNQGAMEMGNGISVMLGLPPGSVTVQRVDVGGAFGPRGAPYAEYALMLHAARTLGAPVKWVSTRSEEFLVDSHGRGIRLEAELGLDREGRFLAYRTRWLCDMGAYLTPAGALTNCMNGELSAAGPYLTPVMHGRHLLVMTNATPVNAYRGAGRPEASYLVERVIDQAAVELGMDRLEIRRRNAIPADRMPYRSPSGSTFDSGDFPRLLDIVAREGDWAGFPARQREAASRGRLRGIGCALFLESAGGGAVPHDQVAVTFSKEGKAVIWMAPQSNGQGHETVFSELLADWLGLDRDEIELRASDPAGPKLVGGGSFGSRSLMTQGSVLQLASTAIIRKGRELAAGMLEASAEDVEFAAGRYRIAGTDRAVTMRAVIAQHGEALDTQSQMQIPRAFPSAAHVAEVELDPETGIAEIVAYAGADDAGKVYNKTLVQGQLMGGVVQGAGQVFGEACSYDPETGQPLAGSFMDYFMPRADLVPGIRFVDASVPSPNNPLGAKGVGESGTVGAAPTLMNALVDALRQRGIAQFDMPATPARVWAALQAA